MSSTSGHSPVSTPASAQYPCFDGDEFKDVYSPPSPEIQFVQVQQLFEAGGYVICRAELCPHGLPLAYLRMRRKTAHLIEDQRKFQQHIEQILSKAPPLFSQAEIDAHHADRSILISFLWEAPAPAFTETDLETQFDLLPP